MKSVGRQVLPPEAEVVRLPEEGRRSSVTQMKAEMNPFTFKPANEPTNVQDEGLNQLKMKPGYSGNIHKETGPLGAEEQRVYPEYSTKAIVYDISRNQDMNLKNTAVHPTALPCDSEQHQELGIINIRQQRHIGQNLDCEDRGSWSQQKLIDDTCDSGERTIDRQAKKILPPDQGLTKDEVEVVATNVVKVNVKRPSLKRSREQEVDDQVEQVTNQLQGCMDGITGSKLLSEVPRPKYIARRISSRTSVSEETHNRNEAFALIKDINSVCQAQPNVEKRKKLDRTIEKTFVSDLKWEQLCKGDLAGSGTFGVVQRCTDAQQKCYVLKYINKGCIEPNEVLVPLDLMKTGVVPRVCGLRWDGRTAAILQDDAGKTLKEAMDDKSLWMEICKPQKLQKIMLDVFRGLEVAHKHGIRHRDVKVENVCWNKETGKVLLIDWGSSRTAQDKSRPLADMKYSGSTPECLPPIHGYRLARTHVYKETLNPLALNMKDDVFGAGMLSVDIISGCHRMIQFYTRQKDYPQFPTAEQTIMYRLKVLEEYGKLHNQSKLPEGLLKLPDEHKQMETLVRCCLTVDERQRWTAQQAVSYLQDCLRQDELRGGKRMKTGESFDEMQVDEEQPQVGEEDQELNFAFTRKNAEWTRMPEQESLTKAPQPEVPAQHRVSQQFKAPQPEVRAQHRVPQQSKAPQPEVRAQHRVPQQYQQQQPHYSDEDDEYNWIMESFGGKQISSPAPPPSRTLEQKDQTSQLYTEGNQPSQFASASAQLLPNVTMKGTAAPAVNLKFTKQPTHNMYFAEKASRKVEPPSMSPQRATQAFVPFAEGQGQNLWQNQHQQNYKFGMVDQPHDQVPASRQQQQQVNRPVEETTAQRIHKSVAMSFDTTNPHTSVAACSNRPDDSVQHQFSNIPVFLMDDDE